MSILLASLVAPVLATALVVAYILRSIAGLDAEFQPKRPSA